MCCDNCTPDKGYQPVSNTKKEYDALIKIVIIGATQVGKTSILARYIDDKFEEKSGQDTATIGLDFAVKTENIDDKVLKLQIWDTGGQERFAVITTSYYRGAHAFILVYDEANKDSLDVYKERIQQHGCDDAPVLILQSKTDIGLSFSLRSQLFFNGYRRRIENNFNLNIPYEIMEICEMYYGGICKGSIMAEENEWMFYPVSAKTGLNITTAFTTIARRAYAYGIAHRLFERNNIRVS